MSPRTKNRKVVVPWTKTESSQLILSIKAQLKKHDPLPYSRRISSLNWKEITIPRKSVKECKSQLDLLIKKIHRTRTLEEILSEVEVEPVDVICEQSVSKMTENDVDSGLIDNNKNSPAIRCFYRKSEGSSKVNGKYGSEIAQMRSGAFALFAKQNYSKNAGNDSLKARYDQLADREKLLWIEKAVVASSEGEKAKNILTNDEYALLLKVSRERNQAIESGTQNNPSDKCKRKLAEDATRGSTKKTRKIEESPIDENIDEMQSSSQEVTLSNNWIHSANVVHQVCSNSHIEMEIRGAIDESAVESVENGDATYDVITETTEIDQSPYIPSEGNNSSFEVNIVIGTIDRGNEVAVETTQELLDSDNRTGTMEKSEENSKIEEVRAGAKEEVTEPPRPSSRIRRMLAALFGRFGNWGGRK